MNWGSARLNRRAVGRASLAVGILFCAGCGPRTPERAPAIGEAYVAGETLPLRKEIATTSGALATAKCGERVEILQHRRRFVKVRTAAGQEGWTEQNQLLTPPVFEQIQHLAKQSTGAPHMGVYRARDKLNIHIEPARSAPSIYQLKEDEKVDLLARRLTERSAGPQTAPAVTPAGAPAPEKPRAFDDWCLVRTAGGLAGWALARQLDADIPDEVAQYAEGRRVTSYFPLTEVRDGELVKKIWLWTTIEKGVVDLDFDSFRVFTWGRRRHRYETAYIERRLKGFFPVSVAPEVKTRYGTGPGFSFVLEKKDGRRYIRHYILLGNMVRFYGDEPVPPAAEPTSALKAEAAPAKPQEAPGLLRRLWQKLRRGS